MTIAVQISSLTGTEINSGENFNYQCFTLLAAKHPGDHFIFIFDSPFDPSLIIHPNITPVLLGPQIKNNLLQHYWYNYKLPKLLSKYNAACFISNSHVCSLRTDAEQVIFINDLSVFLQKPGRYTKKYAGRFFNTAANIIFSNNWTKEKFNRQYSGQEEKSMIIPPVTDPNYVPLSFNEKELIKNRLTGGAEFFLYFDLDKSVEKTITVLKAFSLFKKWQHSGMQLLISTNDESAEKLKKNLSSYKFREHVKIITEEKDIAGILPPAYAALFLPVKATIEYNMLLSLKCNAPLILASNELFADFFKDAAAYTEVNEKAVSEKMMLLYKDENRRNLLINNGQSLARPLTRENAASQIWHAINPVMEP